MHLGLDSVGSSYSELVSKVGSSVGVADGEPYTEWILRTVAFLWVNFASGCKSVVCFKKVVV
jgi:hypothetical protein